MTPNSLANIWCNGDLPFRPRWLAQCFMLSRTSRNPALAANIAMELIRHGPGVAQTFALCLTDYQRDPQIWELHHKLSAYSQEPLGFRDWSFVQVEKGVL